LAVPWIDLDMERARIFMLSEEIEAKFAAVVDAIRRDRKGLSELYRTQRFFHTLPITLLRNLSDSNISTN